MQHNGSSRERLTARGQRPSPARARTPRGWTVPLGFGRAGRRGPGRAVLAHLCGEVHFRCAVVSGQARVRDALCEEAVHLYNNACYLYVLFAELELGWLG